LKKILTSLFLIIFSVTCFIAPFQELYALDLTPTEQQTLNDLEIKLGDKKEELEENLKEVEAAIKTENLEDKKEELEAQVDEKKDELENKVEDVKEQAQEQVQNIKDDIAKEKAKLMKRIEEEKRILTNAAKNEFIPGMGLSLFSLMAATIIGPLMAYLCIDQTSVKIYTATAAYYLIKELTSWKKFKAGMMVTMKRLETVDISENKSLRENLKNGVGFVRSQLDFMDAQLELLEEGFEAIEKKAENAKIASFGFAAAGGAALLETYVLDGGLCKGWSKNEVKEPFELRDLMNLVIAPAYAGNEKQLDYAGDIDKLGIVVGGLVTSAFVALIYKSYFPGAKSFLKLGGTRSALFLANAGIAMLASQKLKKASEIYLNRIKDLKSLSQQLRGKLEMGNTFATTLLNKLDQLGKMAEKYGITAPKKLSEMTITELKDFATTIETQAKDQLSIQDTDLLKDVKQSLGIKTSEVIKKKSMYRFSFIHLMITSFTLDAYAEDCVGKSGRFDFQLDPNCQCRQKKTCKQMDVVPIKSDPNNFYNTFLKNFKGMADSTFYGVDKKEDAFKKNVMLIGPKVQLVNQQLKKSINSNLAKNNKPSVPFGKLESAVTKANNKLLSNTFTKVKPTDSRIATIPQPNIESSPSKLLAQKRTEVSTEKNKIDIKVLNSIREKIAREIAEMKKKNPQQHKNYQYQNEINNNKDLFIFDIISLRYLKSGQHLYNE